MGWTQKNTEDCVWTTFQHENGVVASEGCFVDGRPEGIWSSYSDQGVLLSEGERRNHQPHGKWSFYINGRLSEETTFDQGIKFGAQVLWDNDVLTDSLGWMRGTKEGRHVHFHPNGKPQWELFYEKDNKASDSLYDFRSFYFQKVFFDDNGLICEYQLSIAQYENSVRYFFQAKDQELYAYKIGVSLNDQKVLSLDTLKTLKLTK